METHKKMKITFVGLLCVVWMLLTLSGAMAEPIGPVVTSISNSTTTTATNTSRNESQGGAYIYTLNLNGAEQNSRWKAYVGNITGSLKLDDANSFTFYEWNLGTLTGQVYATRSSGVINWSNVNCSWGWQNESSNRTVSANEDIALSHSKLDNISSTFTSKNNSAITVGTRTIAAETCYTASPYVNDTAQSSTTLFVETLLYDGSNSTNGNLLYTATVENNVYGYRNGSVYDFQLMVPENGATGWSSTTAYYFYVELS
ncbi:MAG: hypothetical protein ABH879_07170 [archaeon]